MNKADLSKALVAANPEKLTQKKAKEVINTIMEIINGSLAKGEKVQLVGFGNWQVRARAARKGRNPRTGETIQIEAKNVVKFKAGKGLAEAVNGQA